MPLDASMTYADIKKAVAVRAALVRQDTDTGRKEVPTVDPDLDMIERAVRDGTAEFYDAADFAFKTVFTAITLDADGDAAMNINGDASRYLLPPQVQSLPKTVAFWRGPINAPGGPVAVRHMDEVVQRSFVDPQETGHPVMVGAEFNPLLSSGLSGRGGIELRVFPAPDQAYSLGFRCKVGLIPWVADDQRGQWPAVHDLTVVAFAVRALFREDREAGSKAKAEAENEAAMALARSIARDNDDYRPQTIGAADENGWPGGRRVELYDYTTESTLLSVTVAA